MAVNLTFNKIGNGDIEVHVVGAFNTNSIAQLNVGTPVDVEQYLPAEPWLPSDKRIMITPINDSDIASITPSIQHVLTFTQTGSDWFSQPLNDEDAVNGLEFDIVTLGESVVSPYNRVYLVDSDIIADFAGVVPQIIIASGDDTIKIDVTDYVIALLNVPFEIPADVVDTATDITIGQLNTQVQAPVVTTDKVIVPAGDIVVTGLHGNSLDYVATEYQLVLPYIANVLTLRPEQVIGKTVSVEYVLDVYHGNMTVNVYDGGDVPIASESAAVGRTIPFRTFNTTDITVGTAQGLDNNTTKAYIRKNFREIVTGDFGSTITIQEKLDNVSGFVKVEEVELVCSATADEKREIRRLLKSGVYLP